MILPVAQPAISPTMIHQSIAMNPPFGPRILHLAWCNVNIS
jgi:hypothetical protein